MMKKLLLLTCLCVMQSVCYAYDDILNVEVGETFTVDGGYYRYIQGVLWDYDTSVFETVSVNGYSTKGRFKAISPTPPAGSIIQATIYYYRDGTTSSGVNKAVASWKIYVEDDGSESTVSLPPTLEMEVGEITKVSAKTGSSKYSGNFSWSPSKSYVVDVIGENGNTATLRANSAGHAYIYVTLDNGNTAQMYVTVRDAEYPTVTASPGSGSYEKGTKIYLSASMNDATIRYTTDGSTPTASSREYYSYLTLNESFTLKARAYNSSGAGGEVMTCEYTLKEPESAELSYSIISSTDKTVEVVSNEDGYEYKGNIVIPKTVIIGGVTYTVVRIGDKAFYDCSILTSITIPNSVTSIGESAFGSCSSLTSITIPNSVTAIGKSAFISCESLTSITIPNSVTAIGNWAFAYCSSLTSISIPNSVTSIGEYAFNDCESLTSITIPNSVTSIGEYAFNDCESLTSITIPNSVTSIGEYAFNDCESLTSITIPNSVTAIGNWAFAYCSSLTSISIPNSVTAIGNYAFSGCSSLTSIDVDVDNEAYSSNNGILYNKLQTNLICCPGGKSEKVIVPNSVTSIGNRAFYYCRSLTSISIPNSVTAIGDYAFCSCRSLTSITIPNSVTAIGNWAFAYCRSLTSITLPNSVTSIGGSAFSDCSSLPSISIPNSVTSIGNLAFWNCSSLTSITIPNSVTSIGLGAFAGCSSLTSITIPNSVTSIGLGAFAYCSSLTSITALAVTPPECESQTFGNVDTQECTLYVPDGCKEAYQQAPQWKDFTIIEELEVVSVAEIRLNETEVSLTEGETLQLTAEVLPASATDKTLQWESSDASCVTVDANGLLTAIAQGTATITVRSVYGNAEATCAVTVSPITGIESVAIDDSAKIEVFNLTGAKVADTLENLPAGIYLVREGSTVRKIAVR